MLRRLLILTTIIICLGLLFVFEASVTEALQATGNAYFLVTKQAIWIGVGSIALIAGLLIPTSMWEKFAIPVYVLTTIGLLATFIPGLATPLQGAHRWFSIFGITFQPSEFMKLGLIIMLAKLGSTDFSSRNFLIWMGIPLGLIFLQPDLGSTLLLFSIGVGIFFAAGGSLQLIAGLAGGGSLLALVAILLAPYRLRRLTTFLNPESDPLGASFHIRQITLALGRGGLFGQGLGKSSQRVAYIPEASSDSIFAIVGEEIGFVGSSILIGLYLALLHTCFSITSKQKESSFEYLLGMGITIWIGLQAILNLAAIVALIPLTGMPLPLFSYGGSSLITTMAGIGMMAQLARKKRS